MRYPPLALASLLVFAVVVGCSQHPTVASPGVDGAAVVGNVTAPDTAASLAAVAPTGEPDPKLPGLGDGAPELMTKLRAALAAKSADYTPRTHHKSADGVPTFINRLIFETSPYLLQHAHNPVSWYPWGDAAFERAEREGKPVLMSVGYSTCHWCHVMERESFEDLEIAEYINRHFVAVKVDREERPDVDDIYMSAVNMLAGRGGWPMTTVLTPDREPFFGGTYFPARTGDRGARKGFLTILQELSTRYRDDRESVVAEAKKLSQRIAAQSAPRAPGSVPAARGIIFAARALAQSHDPVWGGFGGAPKFPRPSTLDLLLRYHRRTSDPVALEVAERTLEKMAAGGMHDHVGGGFHRYSVDARWLVPHFEKMLYDNAQLTETYLEAYQLTDRADFAKVASRTLDYIAREMTDAGGGFYSATDADSPAPGGHDEEGWFFTWTPDELVAVLGPDTARIVSAYHGVTARGNFEGRNILHLPRTHTDSSLALKIAPDALEETIDAAHAALLAARVERPPPIRDDKIITAWNGLMLGAFARGGAILERPDFIDRARAAATFVLEKLRTPDGRLRRTYKDGAARFNGYLEDYAYLIDGLLDLYEASGEVRWLTEARALQTTLDAHYRDVPGGGYFTTSDDHEALLARDKPDYDGAEPAGNSVAAMNLVRLYELTDEQAYRKSAEALFSAFADALERGSTGLPKMLCALDFYLDSARQVVIVAPTDAAANPLLAVLRGTFLPNKVVALTRAERVAADAGVVPLLGSKVARDNKATAYVCEQGRCEQPTTDPAVLRTQLAKVVRPLTLIDGSAPTALPRPNAGATPKPWQYDPKTDKHWHPGHGHWHQGKAPPQGRR